MINEIPWRYEGADTAISYDELKALVYARRIEPEVLTFPVGRDDTFPASWLLEIWQTDAQGPDHRRMGLIEVFYDYIHRNHLTERNRIWCDDRQLALSLDEFQWDVPEKFHPVPAGATQSTALADPAYDVFLSYCRSDLVLVERLEKDLILAGLKVWRDERLNETAAGANVSKQITAELRASKKVIVLWTKHSITSDWVIAEADRARFLKRIVPIMSEPGLEIPLPFNGVHTLLLGDIQANPSLLLRTLGATQAEPKARFQLIKTSVRIDRLPIPSGSKLYGRERELRAMLESWDRGEVSIVALDAVGGAGKSALVHHFLQAMEEGGWRGAESVFGWTFHASPLEDRPELDSSEFFEAAFAHFSNGKVRPPSEHDQRGAALAELVKTHRALLVLDGLEPFQYAAGSSGGAPGTAIEGGIRDKGIQSLLANLAIDHAGLCIVTTRIKPQGLEALRKVRLLPLSPLSTLAAIKMLRDLGVEPGFGPKHFQLPPQRDVKKLYRAGKFPADYTPSEVLTKDRAFMHATLAVEFVKAVHSLQHHAFSLNLAGRYLSETGLPLSALLQLPNSSISASRENSGPYRIMEEVEHGLINRLRQQLAKKEELTGTAAANQLGLLYFLGLFNRPVELNLLEVVFAKTEPAQLRKLDYSSDSDLLRAILANMSSAGIHELRSALSQLARKGLVSMVKSSSKWTVSPIDCHPMVREYFGARFKLLDPIAYQSIQGRLYDHYRSQGLPPRFQDPACHAALALAALSTAEKVKQRIHEIVAKRKLPLEEIQRLPSALRQLKKADLPRLDQILDRPLPPKDRDFLLPNNLDGMDMLLTAIRHGCEAGRVIDVFYEVYWSRICRGDNAFGVTQLGLWEKELTALACFFDQPFTKPRKELAESDQALLLNLASVRLRACGRVEEAIKPAGLAIAMLVKEAKWSEASILAGNRSEMHVILGKLDAAVTDGKNAVIYADRSEVAFNQESKRAIYANALLQIGKLSEAESFFRDAERRRKARETDMPALVSISGYLYTGLILVRGLYEEAAKRASYGFMVAQVKKWPMEMGLSRLHRVQAELMEHLHRQPLTPGGFLSQSPGNDLLKRYHEAVADIRQANKYDYLPLALLALSEAEMLLGQSDAESDSLQEAEAIAVRGPMPLVLTGVALLKARMAVKGGNFVKAQAESKEVKKWIRRHSFQRSQPELMVLEAEIAVLSNASPKKVKAALELAISAVQGEGWWSLMPRLEALLETQVGFGDDLAELRYRRAAYGEERAAYLKSAAS